MPNGMRQLQHTHTRAHTHTHIRNKKVLLIIFRLPCQVLIIFCCFFFSTIFSSSSSSFSSVGWKGLATSFVFCLRCRLVWSSQIALNHNDRLAYSATRHLGTPFFRLAHNGLSRKWCTMLVRWSSFIRLARLRRIDYCVFEIYVA